MTLSPYGQMHKEVLERILDGYQAGRFEALKEQFPLELFRSVDPKYDEREEIQL